ncbi:MAG: AraC family transcriptional regulator [Leptolyngbya foveolarum]|uniref:AraC family transcriptional regulator n=1 Tax=Leptolyngbya foveolarum TaxID=47253 RepID=A0A2W4WIC3_9CYAN|nr:MAG: AraC family transcriptional regulator [Leptolyngbya foveolarum]
MGDRAGANRSSHIESARLWQSATSGVELFEARLLTHKFGKHIHDAYTVGLNETGQGQCFYRKEMHQHHPGSFNCINPGEVHTGEAISGLGWGFRNLYVSVATVEQVIAQLDWPDNKLPKFFKMVVDDPTLQQTFYSLFHSLDDPTSQLEQQSLLLQFLSHLFSRHACVSRKQKGAGSESKAVSLVLDYLAAHCTEDVSVNDLARLVDLSPHYLIRCFGKQVGLPPHRYKHHLQLLKAKRSLHSQKPLAEIAIDNGFYDQSHFNRAFKQTFGLPPGHYRQVNFIQDGH